MTLSFTGLGATRTTGVRGDVYLYLICILIINLLETPSRATFRSTLSQPSQMGNFKHQSLRTSDRDRDRDRDKDGEKDRERDIRDKEGQERLRNVSSVICWPYRELNVVS
jgi:hypothetical protein